jgi:hypothetical protein
MATVNLSIIIGDPSLNYTAGDDDFVFGVMIEKCKRSTESEYGQPPLLAAYGDLKITTSGLTNQSNFIEYIVSNKFLNKKTINISLFDTNSLNYSNGLFTSDNYEVRTTTWEDGTTTLSLIDRLANNKFKLYNKSRQKISATILSSTYPKPLSYWGDSNQPSKKFILGSYTYLPTGNEYSCDWYEYDNSEVININNAN